MVATIFTAFERFEAGKPSTGAAVVFLGAPPQSWPALYGDDAPMMARQPIHRTHAWVFERGTKRGVRMPLDAALCGLVRPSRARQEALLSNPRAR